MDGMFSSPQEGNGSRSSKSPGLANSDCHLPSAGDALADAVDMETDGRSRVGDRESPDDAEKEERRRAAHRVLGKQG